MAYHRYVDLSRGEWIGNGTLASAHQLRADCRLAARHGLLLPRGNERNIGKIPGAAQSWVNLIKPCLRMVRSEIVLDRPIVFSKTQDLPVLFSAIGAKAHYLVTSDTTNFTHVLETTVYGVNVRTPKSFPLEMGKVGL